MKSIFDLCRELPGSEPELRERAEDFNRAVWLAVADDMYSATRGTPNYLNSIADAKAATDRMIEKGWQLNGGFNPFERVWWYLLYRQPITIEVTASTEPLARSAAALLAAEAMKGGK